MSRLVPVLKQGKNILDVTISSPTQQFIKKIDKERYVDLRNGEIKNFRFSNDKKSQNLRRTIKGIRQTINHNFRGNLNELFITLTYKDGIQNPMNDKNKLYYDFRKFWKSVNYNFKSRNLGYIAIAEPQENTAWHLHILLKDCDNKVLYIDNDLVEKLWGNGFTKTQRNKGDNVGAYLSAYLSNLDGKKGSRLPLYPKDFKFYRYSKNIVKPIPEYMAFNEIFDEYGEPVFNKDYEITNDNGVIIKRVTHMQFNKLRNNK